MSADKFNIFRLADKKIVMLHMSWVAFFITFFMWFSHSSLLPLIQKTFGLSPAETKALLFLNVALTIPSRTLVGALVDKFGPRLMFSVLLVISGGLCIGFALAQSYEQLAAFRFLLGFAGAGFVIGIRLITEWFPAKQAGTAQGIYGGWGNFGAAAAGFLLPALAGWFGGDEGWRGAAGSAGIVAILYAFIFYKVARNTPKGSTYFKPKKLGPMEVTSKFDLVLYIIMCAPMFVAMGVIAWRLSPAGVSLLSDSVTWAIWGALVIWFIYQVVQIYRVNAETLKTEVPELHRYKFKQVALLNLSYMVTFGSEVAVVSMLPLFFINTFGVSIAAAGAMASSFMVMNLVARPGGGYISDKVGRKVALLITVIGSGLGYWGMSHFDSSWSIPATMAVVIFCSFFVQAGAGATFGVVPTIKRRLTGQIAGLTGAYGNIGAASYLLVYSLTDATTFFTVIGLTCAVVAVLLMIFMEEPKGQIAELMPDGSVQLIDVGR
ncbi:MAG: MFS transporter [Hahellaceae bacterium]|nr:MFS transporter [Hahellaceae bacterium]